MLKNITLDNICALDSDVKEMLSKLEKGEENGFLLVWIPLSKERDGSPLSKLIKGDHSLVSLSFDDLRHPILDGDTIEAEVSYKTMRGVMDILEKVKNANGREFTDLEKEFFKEFERLTGIEAMQDGAQTEEENLVNNLHWFVSWASETEEAIIEEIQKSFPSYPGWLHIEGEHSKVSLSLDDINE